MASLTADPPSSLSPSSPLTPPPPHHAPPSSVEPQPDAAKASSHLDQLLPPSSEANTLAEVPAESKAAPPMSDEAHIAQEILDAVRLENSVDGHGGGVGGGGLDHEEQMAAALVSRSPRDAPPLSPAGLVAPYPHRGRSGGGESDDDELLPPPKARTPDPYGQATPPPRTSALPPTFPDQSSPSPAPAALPSISTPNGAPLSPTFSLASAVSPVSPSFPPSPSSATTTTRSKLGALKTHPADLVSLSNPDPHGASVPNTPISPTAGDVGHGDSMSLLGHASHASHAYGNGGGWVENGSIGSRRGSLEQQQQQQHGRMNGFGEAGLLAEMAALEKRREEEEEEDNRPLAQAAYSNQYPSNGSPVLPSSASRPNSRPSSRLFSHAENSDAVESLQPPSASFASPPASPFASGSATASTSRAPPPSSFDPSTPAKRISAHAHGRAASIATGNPSTHASSAYARGADLLFSPASPVAGAPPPPSAGEKERSRAMSAAPAPSQQPLINGVTGAALPTVSERGASPAPHYTSTTTTTTSGVVPPPSRHVSQSSSSAHPPSRGPSTRERERERTREESAGSAAGGTVQPGAGNSTRSRRQLGEWQMTKTLGAGSMGKVKLGVSGRSGEKVAIKIIPRFTSTASAQRALAQSQSQPADSSSGAGPSSSDPQAKPSASFLAKAAAKDASKEVRTMREGSLCLLLHHPYVCGMKEMLIYPHHYYFVQEYVNGGQMLDYIISHGRLRERSARKFARQIGSALEYCHANSIVHRDLKIENILISKTGNIKIIDFGLSNLYSPVSHLSTFCGSLYFAAPELLNAKPYTGPEVDVWSFGIVLYVLVCGKVPFDDQSMPALHAKIKRGQVEYPAWLSSECKSLLARMLVTTPSHRATLTEVLSHPWMVKGFPTPPAGHIPARVPLRFGELDEEVLRGMTGFEFGSEAEISARLGEILQSDLYRQAVRNWEGRRNSYGGGGGGGRASGSGFSNGVGGGSGIGGGDASDSDKERPAMRTDGRDMKRSPSTNKRFSGLGFYGKKIAGGFNAAFAGATAVSPGGGGGRGGDEIDALAAAAGVGGSYGPSGTFVTGGGTAPRPEQLDPTRGFHPLISVYYLVKEKIERERIWGPGVFASSTLSLTGPPPPPAPAQAYQAGSISIAPPAPSSSTAHNGGGLSSPPPIASPLVPMTPQPRQRANGEEFSPHLSLGHHTAPPPVGSRNSGEANRNSHSRRSSYVPTSSSSTAPQQQQQTPSTPLPRIVASQQGDYEPPNSPSPRERKASNRMSLMFGGGGGGGGGDSSVEREQQSQPHVDDIPLSSSTSQSSSSGGFARRFGSLLGRSSPSTSPSASSGHRTRASIGGIGHKAGGKTVASPLPQVAEGLAPPASPTPGATNQGALLPTSGSDVPLASPPDGQAVQRASTVGEISPARHQRTVSMGAAALQQPHQQTLANHSVGRAAGGGGGFFERRRQSSVSSSATAGGPPPRRGTTGDIAGMFDEQEEELVDEQQQGQQQQQQDARTPVAGRSGSPISTRTTEGGVAAFGAGRTGSRTSGAGGGKESLLSSSSTAGNEKSEGAKPVWLKGLFSVSTTSTKPIATLRSDLVRVLDRLGVQHRDVKNGFECAHMPSIDLSSVGGGGGAASQQQGGAAKSATVRGTIKRRASKLLLSGKDGEKQQPSGDESQTSLQASTIAPTLAGGRGESSSSFTPVGFDTNNGATSSAAASPTLPHPSQFGTSSSSAAPVPQRSNSDLVVRFEITLVKMPLLPGIHGLQFRRIGGNAWQYQMLAQRVLKELKL